MSDLFEPAAGRRSLCKPDPKALAQRMTRLRALAQHKGYFNVPIVEQALRGLELAALPVVAFGLLTMGGVAAACGAVVLALHYLRTAFLGHDLAHSHWGSRAAAKPRFMLGATALLQGFGSTWWVEKHELHHAFPNACRVSDNGVLTPIDGDIDSAPWIVWDKTLAEYNSNAAQSVWGKRLVSAWPGSRAKLPGLHHPGRRHRRPSGAVSLPTGNRPDHLDLIRSRHPRPSAIRVSACDPRTAKATMCQAVEILDKMCFITVLYPWACGLPQS